MQKTIGMLVILLAAQLVLAVGMSFTGPNLTADRPDTPLLDLGDRTVDRLTIEGSDNQQIILARQGDDWVLPETGDFPADNARVDHLLERLKGLKRGLAVATTTGAQKRFKVSDDAFERRVMLARSDETLATLYFGTSPGMRRVHARTGEDESVFTTAFAIHDAPVKPEDWEDKGVLKIPQGEIESIGLTELTLTRALADPAGGTSGDDDNKTTGQVTWNAGVLQDGEMLNQARADALADKLAGLSIGSVLGREAMPEYGMEAPVLAFSVQRKGGESIEYRLGKRDKENDYVLKVSSRPEYFRLPGYTADALITAAGRNQLVTAATQAADEGEAVQDPDESLPAEGGDEPDPTMSEEGAS